MRLCSVFPTVRFASQEWACLATNEQQGECSVHFKESIRKMGHVDVSLSGVQLCASLLYFVACSSDFKTAPRRTIFLMSAKASRKKGTFCPRVTPGQHYVYHENCFRLEARCLSQL
jgi:hypothetical protein